MTSDGSLQGTTKATRQPKSRYPEGMAMLSPTTGAAHVDAAASLGSQLGGAVGTNTNSRWLGVLAMAVQGEGQQQ